MRITFDNKHALIPGILNYIYPSRCPACKNITDNIIHAPFCSPCWTNIKRYSGPSCRICSTPFVSEHAFVCAECIKNPPLFSKGISFGLYEDVLASAINHFKFHGVRRLYKPLGKFLLKCDISGIDAVIPVPLSIKGLRSRGFNQSLLLSKYLSDKIKVPLMPDGIRKIKDTPPQIGLSAKERISNLKGAFMTDKKFKGKRLLLVDDVMTTGATVRECSKQLMKAEAKEVVVLTLARAGNI